MSSVPIRESSVSVLDDNVVASFLEVLLTNLPSTPEKDYRKLCEAWQIATGADWIWLWLVHRPLASGQPSAMQLVARSKGLGSLPKRTHHLNPTSVAAYCAHTGNIEVVYAPLRQWEKETAGIRYMVSMAEELEDLGCKMLVCVPVHMPPLSPAGYQIGPDNIPVISGVVCLHYKASGLAGAAAAAGQKQLKVMGQASAQALLNSYQALQRTILLALDEIAHRHLTDRSHDFESVCNQYAASAVKVICAHLQVKGVSLFYRDSLRGGIQCLATTGLQWYDGRRINTLPEVHYGIGEGRTGRCYQSGMAEVLIDGLDQSQAPKTVELINGRSEMALPATLYPIPLPRETATSFGEPRSLGVIRCKYHHSDLLKGAGLTFDPIELQTLGFIAQQIAPVLETLELNIARERVISVTKHDLNMPIGTIHHKTFNLRLKDAKSEDTYVWVKWYDIHDISVCTMMCLNLVTQLDRDPYSFIPDASPEKIPVEGRILAPLKNMLAHYAREQNEMRIEFDGCDFFPYLWLDPTLMHRVLFNLITNAAKYGKMGTTIRINGRIGADVYYIDVNNEGNGIAEDEVHKIFTPKYRSPRTSKTVFGMGLGLAIARACLEKCGCSLELTRRANPTTFSIRIPAALEGAPARQKGDRYGTRPSNR